MYRYTIFFAKYSGQSSVRGPLTGQHHGLHGIQIEGMRLEGERSIQELPLGKHACYVKAEMGRSPRPASGASSIPLGTD